MDKLLLYIKEGLRDLRKNKGRTFLTSLGIVIGVYSVVLLMSLGEGIKIYIEKQFQAMGSDMVYVFPFKISEAMGSSMPTRRFSSRDLKAIKGQVKGAVAPVIESSIIVQKNKERISSTIIGTTRDLLTMMTMSPEGGRFFTTQESMGNARIVVIGPKIKKELFPYTTPIGKYITLQNLPFRIVGVFKSKGVSGFGGSSDLDMHMFIPIKAAQQITGEKGYLAVYAKPYDKMGVDSTILRIKHILQRYYKDDEFSTSTQEELLNTVNAIFSVINAVLVGIAAISLLVGGVGIMNIMYVTIAERTKEVGIRRALGATKKDILVQFIILAILLTGIGGGIGLLLAWGTTLILQHWFPATITPIMPIIAFGVSCGIGLIFGVLPARKAASVSPLEAIRSE